jgi:hypothetical protein
VKQQPNPSLELSANGKARQQAFQRIAAQRRK